jgi:hypothetical protein
VRSYAHGWQGARHGGLELQHGPLLSACGVELVLVGILGGGVEAGGEGCARELHGTLLCEDFVLL